MQFCCRWLVPWMRLDLLIGLLYWTNGTNGIAMQAFSRLGTTRPSNSNNSETTTKVSSNLRQQLSHHCNYWESVMGLCLLHLLRWKQQQGKSLTTAASAATAAKPLAMTTTTSTRYCDYDNDYDCRDFYWFIDIRGHAWLGSLCTNVVFMYGLAAVVDVIRLLEPFETLLLMAWLGSNKNSNQHDSHVAAISLLPSSELSAAVHPHAIGLPSCRVWPCRRGMFYNNDNSGRRHHHRHQRKQNHLRPKSRRRCRRLWLPRVVVLRTAAAVAPVLITGNR